VGDAGLRTIGVITTARSDYGILLPVLRAIDAAPDLALHLIVGGMHLVPEFGRTVDAIARDFPIGDRVEMLLASDTPLGIAKSIGLGVSGFAESYARIRPDLLLALGDRFEMHAAVLAALPFGIPVAHVHGGEVTEGAIDDALRHGISKFAHLHFTATREHAERLMRMGEEPWRITVSGAPSLDNLRTVRPLSANDLTARFGIPFEPARLLVTFHPVTRQHERTPAQIDALLAAVERSGIPAVFTLPNADTGGRLVAERIRAYVAGHPDAVILDNLGTEAYFGIMRAAAAMVGNSSSGLIEAPSFGLPVVNVGQRQAGRTRGANVIDVAADTDPDAIAAAIAVAVSPAFRAGLAGHANPYAGAGPAAEAIVERLRAVALDERLTLKRFHDG
jgi:UDP-N-acetylglucosamine 2-epimerase (non-hydrolysing)/GDP/UDP-N,N'-diacetylbacillosamine 2-epimerase (hydrolysing)